MSASLCLYHFLIIARERTDNTNFIFVYTSSRCPYFSFLRITRLVRTITFPSLEFPLIGVTSTFCRLVLYIYHTLSKLKKRIMFIYNQAPLLTLFISEGFSQQKNAKDISAFCVFLILYTNPNYLPNCISLFPDFVSHISSMLIGSL